MSEKCSTSVGEVIKGNLGKKTQDSGACLCVIIRRSSRVFMNAVT